MRYLLAALACLFLSSAIAQTSSYNWGFGVHPSTYSFTALENNKIADKSEYEHGVQLSLMRNLSASFDLGLESAIAILRYPDGQERTEVRWWHTRKNFFELNGALRYKLNNGYIIPQNAILAPFLKLGVGYNKFEVEDGEIFIPIGAGLAFNLGEKATISLQTNYKLAPGSDNTYLQHSIGFITHFGRRDNISLENPLLGLDIEDVDYDGVEDAKDKCPDVPGSILADGCPDSDGDGVPDNADRCPDVFGYANFLGCRDSDGDGIADDNDKCPKVYGSLAGEGCPLSDRDKDGIYDDLDSCPDLPGVLSGSGCPDADGDGIVDNKDNCPDKFGLLDKGGCPQQVIVNNTVRSSVTPSYSGGGYHSSGSYQSVGSHQTTHSNSYTSVSEPVMETHRYQTYNIVPRDYTPIWPSMYDRNDKRVRVESTTNGDMQYMTYSRATPVWPSATRSGQAKKIYKPEYQELAIISPSLAPVWPTITRIAQKAQETKTYRTQEVQQRSSNSTPVWTPIQRATTAPATTGTIIYDQGSSNYETKTQTRTIIQETRPVIKNEAPPVYNSNPVIEQKSKKLETGVQETIKQIQEPVRKVMESQPTEKIQDIKMEEKAPKIVESQIEETPRSVDKNTSNVAVNCSDETFGGWGNLMEFSNEQVNLTSQDKAFIEDVLWEVFNCENMEVHVVALGAKKKVLKKRLALVQAEVKKLNQLYSRFTFSSDPKSGSPEIIEFRIKR